MVHGLTQNTKSHDVQPLVWLQKKSLCLQPPTKKVNKYKQIQKHANNSEALHHVAEFAAESFPSLICTFSKRVKRLRKPAEYQRVNKHKWSDARHALVRRAGGKVKCQTSSKYGSALLGDTKVGPVFLWYPFKTTISRGTSKQDTPISEVGAIRMGAASNQDGLWLLGI